jgi:hypothetical protein
VLDKPLPKVRPAINAAPSVRREEGIPGATDMKTDEEGWRVKVDCNNMQQLGRDVCHVCLLME